ncbi:MAG: S8 family serine peptidase [Bdellovibrionales bacterium]|nr:S8 family serine peptidase [Bdellovibrionales bacterium]
MGILDSGIDLEHPDLANKVIATQDLITNYPPNESNDGHGHGTHCAGTIVGGAASGQAIGVAPGAQLIVGKIVDDGGSSEFAAILRGMQWIADPDGDPATPDHPHLISNSWGVHSGLGLLEAVNSWLVLGITPIFAAGNRGSNPGTVWAPAQFPDLLAVGAVNSLDQIARFSSRGPVIHLGESYIKPDITAAGVDVLSSSLGGGYLHRSGTSMAAPHVAGVVALMMAANPHLTPFEILTIVRRSAIDLGVKGVDNSYGAGRVDAFDAVRLAQNLSWLSLVVQADGEMVKLSIAPWGRSYLLDSGKKYLLPLPTGQQTLTLSAYRHQPESHSIELPVGQTTKLHLSPRIAPQQQIFLKVQNSDGTLLAAKVRFKGHPEFTQSSDDGNFNYRLYEGSYPIVVEGPKGYRYRDLQLEIYGSENNFILTLETLPAVLIVSDGVYSADYLHYYTRGLDRLKITYSTVNSAQVTATLLTPYQQVIWFTGDASVSTLNRGQRQLLRDYLFKGGRLLISGQDIGFSLLSQADNFYGEVLGARLVEDDGQDYTLGGVGQKFTLNGVDSANNQRSVDILALSRLAHVTAKSIMRYSSSGANAAIINYYGAGVSIYLAFGFEGIQGESERAILMQKLWEILVKK